MSDTPRTDKLHKRQAIYEEFMEEYEKLERELNETVAKGEQITHQLGVAMMQLHESRAREAQLREALEKFIPELYSNDDVKPLVEAATRLCLSRKLPSEYPHAGSEVEYAKEMFSSALSAFTAKHKR